MSDDRKQSLVSAGQMAAYAVLGGQIRLRTENALGSHGMDILALGVGAWSYKVLTDDFSDVNLPPIALPSSRKDD